MLVYVLFQYFYSGILKENTCHFSIKDDRWEAPKWADTLDDPNVNDPIWVKEGKHIYLNQCIVCHGDGGRGDGESGFGLAVSPGDFCDPFTIKESNGSIFWKISNGRGPMPDYESRLSEKHRWQLVAYIRDLQKQYLNSKSKKKK